jgi:hypothetical protein
MWVMLRVFGLNWFVMSFALAVSYAAGPAQGGFVRAGLFDDKNHIPTGARETLEHADQFELLSLSPEHLREPAKIDFHGFKVLGQIYIKDAAVRRKLVLAFERGVRENDGVIAACFNPRHGIHVVHNGKTADFVICFECRQVHAYGDDGGEFLISDSPQPVFDGVLREAHVPLP